MLTDKIKTNETIMAIVIIAIVVNMCISISLSETVIAGGPAYMGQVEVFMLQEKLPQPTIDSALALPTLPAGEFLVVSEDYLFAAVVTVHWQGTISVKVLYDKRSEK